MKTNPKKDTFTFPDGEEYVGEFKGGSHMGREPRLGLMGQSMSGSSRTGSFMDREPSLGLMERSMSGSSRTTRSMDREPSLILMEESMSGDGETTNLGMEPHTIKTGMCQAPLKMVL